MKKLFIKTICTILFFNNCSTSHISYNMLGNSKFIYTSHNKNANENKFKYNCYKKNYLCYVILFVILATYISLNLEISKNLLISNFDDLAIKNNHKFYIENTKCYNYDIETLHQMKKMMKILNISDINSLIKHDLKFLNKLIKEKKLEIFSQAMEGRFPKMNQDKCNFPISSIVVTKKFYVTDNNLVERNCSGFDNFCQVFDWRYHLSYLYKKFRNNRQYILILEDDTQLCPYIFEYIYNISLLNNNSLGVNINLVFLGKGGTGYLIKTSFIPNLIYWIGFDDYPNTSLINLSADFFDKRKKYYPNFFSFYNDLGQAIDYFTNTNQKDSLLTGIYGASLNLIWHSKGYNYSIMKHNITKNNICFTPLYWLQTRSRTYLIEIMTMNVKHVSEYPYNNLRVPGGWRKFKLNRSLCEKKYEFNVPLKSNVSVTNCSKMIPIWNSEGFY